MPSALNPSMTVVATKPSRPYTPSAGGSKPLIVNPYYSDWKSPLMADGPIMDYMRRAKERVFGASRPKAMYIPRMTVEQIPPHKLLEEAKATDGQGGGLITFYTAKARAMAKTLRIRGVDSAIESEIRRRVLESFDKPSPDALEGVLSQEIIRRAEAIYIQDFNPKTIVDMGGLVAPNGNPFSSNSSEAARERIRRMNEFGGHFDDSKKLSGSDFISGLGYGLRHSP